MSDNHPDNPIAIPGWLAAPSHPSHCQSAGDPFAYTIPENPPPVRLTAKDRREIQEQEFKLAFEWVIVRVARGATINLALSEYHIDIDPILFHTWWNNDPELKRRWRVAKKCHADYRMGIHAQNSTGYDRNGLPLDPSFINASNRAHEFAASRMDREEYGDVKHIEVSGGINIVAALEEGQNRVIESRAITIEEEIIELLDEPEASAHEPSESDDDE